MQAPYRIIPEAAEELNRLIPDHNMTLDITTELGFDIDAVAHNGEVAITESALELLWASAHANFIFYQEYVSSCKAEHQQYTVGTTQRSLDAMDLLRWAIEKAKSKDTKEWPGHLPQPVAVPVEHSDIHVANELFLCAVAWSLHHEISHVELRHSFITAPFDLEEEKVADVTASRQVLDTAPNTQQLEKRALGLISALIALQYIDRNKTAPSPQKRLHPYAFERLSHSLGVHAWEPNSMVLAFALVSLQVYLGESKVPHKLEGDTFDDQLNNFFISLSRCEV